MGEWLHEHGAAICYRYTNAQWPLSAYRTDYADTPGSAEIPSAGRPLTRWLLRRLRARGCGSRPWCYNRGVLRGVR
ncbi:MAG: S-adenosylmethionine:tRNA ribosyltransferase-isomerase [Pseudonocardiaceae bacterium]